jgi:peptidoglycan/LPS O-acetylase OafA/YrhL
MFFMISGLYMALILSDKYRRSLKTFYVNRALRIFPTYWLVLLLCALFLRGDVTALFPSSLAARRSARAEH